MKRLISVLLILCLLPVTGFPQAAAAGPFTDIPDDAARQAAELLYRLGVVSGTGGSNYSPGQPFDRAALAVIGTRLSGVFDVSAYGGTVRFPDVRASHWAHRWVNAATAEGLMVGSTDGRFHPEDPMLYGQLITVLMKLLGYTDGDVGLNWPHSYIAKAEALGVSEGMSFTANQKLTRGEAARLIYNFLFTEAKGGNIYIELPVFGAASVETLLVFNVADGKSFIGDYTYDGVLEESMQYKYAKLLTDKDGRVLTVEADGSVTYRQVSVKNDRDSRLELTDGTIVPVPSTAAVFEWDGERSEYAKRDAFLEGEQVKLAVRDGVLLYILRDSDARRLGVQTKENFLLRMYTSGGVSFVVAEDGDYPVKGVIDAAQAGRTGVLTIDREGNALGFVPSPDYTYKTVTVSAAQDNGFFDGDGGFVPVRGTVDVWSDGADKYSGVWSQIRPNEVFLMAYNEAEALQYLYRVSARGSGENYQLAVLEKQPAKGSDPLTDAFGKAAEGAALYKNGFPATPDMLEKWDVLMFYQRSGVVEAGNIRLSGHHSNPRPNPTAPSSLTLMGREFALLPEATARMSQYPAGQRFTFLLAPDGQSIADVRGTEETANSTIGLAKANGVLIGAGPLELTGAPASAELPLILGRVGRVQGSADGRIFITPIETQSGRWGDLNLETKRLGSVPLAPWCVIYDQVGGAGRAERVSLSDLPINRVRADQVLYADVSPSGYVTAVILDDISGDAYIYGMADSAGRMGADSSGEQYVVGYNLRISNGKPGSSEWLICDAFIPPFPQKGGVMGASVTNTPEGNGLVTNLVSCIRYNDLTRADFVGDGSVRLGGKDVPLAASVTEVYIPSMGEYMDIATARSYCRTFEIYTDPWGYKVRFIIGRI